MAGAAPNYSSRFLARVGREILVDSQDSTQGAPPFVELSHYQDFMKFMAGNPEAGPKLRFDLDQDGKISPAEREITEREL